VVSFLAGARDFFLSKVIQNNSRAHKKVLFSGYNFFFFPVVQCPDHEAEADVRNRWKCTCIALYAFMVWTGQL
jgi:hypothetical protein